MATKRIGPLLGEVSRDEVEARQRYSDELAQTTDETLRLQGGGDLALYDALMTDDQVIAAWSQRVAQTTSLPYVVEPGGPSELDRLAADDLRTQLESASFDAATTHMLGAIVRGFSVCELMLELRGTRIALAGFKRRRSRRFTFKRTGELVMLRPERRDMPARKFWTWRYGGDDDDVLGVGIGSALYWPVWFKRVGLKSWSLFLEKQAQGTPYAKLPAGATKTEEHRMLELLGHITQGGRIVVPKHIELSFLESARDSSGDFDRFCARWDASIAKIIVGQTMQTDDGSSRAQAEVHERGSGRISATDADLLCESFVRGPARWLTEWNWPGAATPSVFRQTTTPESLEVIAERDAKIAQLGYRPTAKRIAEVYGEGYEPVPAPIAPQGPMFAEPTLPTPPEPTADDLGSDWREVIGPIEKNLDELLASASTLEEARDRLGELARKNPDELVEALARRRFAGRLAGESS